MRILLSILLLTFGCAATAKNHPKPPKQSTTTNIQFHDNYCELTPEAYDCMLDDK